MKNYLKITGVVALFFVTMAVNASEPILTAGSRSNAKSLVLELDSKSPETSVRLYDAEDNIIFSDYITNAIYAKKFDLKNLTEGSYVFRVENALSAYIYTIDVKKGSVDIVKRKENSKPVFRKKDSVVYLNLLNLDKKDVKIQVTDSSNRMVFEEVVTDEMIVQKVFNFKTANPDGYTISVKDGNDVYYEAIVVQ